MAENRIFTDEELKLMGERTLDLVFSAIDSGDKEGAKRLSKRMYNEFQGMHDLYLDWVTALLSSVYRRHGDQELYDALNDGCTAWTKPFADMYADEQDMRREFLQRRAGLKTAPGDSYLVSGLVLQDIGQSRRSLIVAVCDEYTNRPDAQVRRGHVVHFHEANELAYGDSPVLASGYSIAFELAVVKPFRNRSRGDVTDLRNVTRR